nr:uncharacterized protein LOC112210490 [Halyomorpha halys]
MAKVLEGRGHISKDDYKPYGLIFHEPYIRNFIYGGIQALIKGMRASWGKEWADTADKLDEMTFEELSKRMRESADFDEDTFKCLNHGDCWNNNMMFKHNWEGRPIEIRFVDFQFPHYNSPCIDLIYFIYSSIQPEIRRQNYKSFIQLYYESLTSNLDRFGYEGSKPSLEEIENVMSRLSLFGLNFFLGFFPITNSVTDDAVDFDELFESNGEEGYNTRIFGEAGLIEKIGEEIKALVKLQSS